MGSFTDETTAQWTLRSPTADGWQELAREFELHPLAARMLARRGYDDPGDAASFLDPKLRDMHDPASMAGMDDALDEVLGALEAGSRIMVHGDYDVDGLSSTAVLVQFFRSLGADVDYTIPHRIEDGYGLDAERIRSVAERDFDVLITADCGITAREEIEMARERGLRVVVIDHHAVPDELPRAHAVLNPRLPECDFPFDELAAAGVAFNFVVALRRALRNRGRFEGGDEPELMQLLDLVALGTVADVMPLVDENRAFVQRGLELMTERPRPGLRALLERCRSEEGPVTTQTIAYKVAPRLNAAGRLSDASMCVELMTTRDDRRARAIADRLESLNAERRSIQSEILEGAREQACAQLDDGADLLFVEDEDWHRGVLGIVAGRLADEFHRPALALEHGGATAHGSARSIDGLDMVEILAEADELLADYGGHEAAAGLSLEASRIEELRDRLAESVAGALDGREPPAPSVEVEERVQLGTLDRRFVRDLHRLRPFGAGNPEPVLACEQLRAKSARIVGEDHLKAEFSDGTGELECIGFSMADRMELLEEPVAAAFVPKWSVFRGRGQLELHLRDVRPAAHALFEGAAERFR